MNRKHQPSTPAQASFQTNTAHDSVRRAACDVRPRAEFICEYSVYLTLTFVFYFQPKAVVKQVLSVNPSVVDAVDVMGRTALHLAAKEQLVDTLCRLLYQVRLPYNTPPMLMLLNAMFMYM
jgi:ankyrin repeat protein